MASLSITALSCGICHRSGIAAWRCDDNAPFEVIYVSDTFRHVPAAAATTPAFVCQACGQPALVAPLKTTPDSEEDLI